MIKSYLYLSKIDNFIERYEYLRLGGVVGNSTFGFDRYLNQGLYKSSEWKSVRGFVITRDNGCDLGVPEYEIHGSLLVHHMNPMVSDDIIHGESSILDPEFLITTTQVTHNAIHYGDRSLLKRPYVARSRGDTKLW